MRRVFLFLVLMSAANLSFAEEIKKGEVPVVAGAYVGGISGSFVGSYLAAKATLVPIGATSTGVALYTAPILPIIAGSVAGLVSGAAIGAAIGYGGYVIYEFLTED